MIRVLIAPNLKQLIKDANSLGLSKDSIINIIKNDSYFNLIYED